jgi:hypothetical protein
MMSETIERAAVSATADDIATKLRHAPAWVRSAVAKHGRVVALSEPVSKHGTTPASKPTARAQAPAIGWLAGTCCPGVSRPCYCTRDRERLPEQFTGDAMAMMLEQARAMKQTIALRYGHDGPVIASTDGVDLLFRMDRFSGLEFEARLRDNELSRKILGESGTGGWGVSIGYRTLKQWHVERDGIGRVRVVDAAVLDHVAIVAKGTSQRAAYEAARAFCVAGSPWACPSSVRISAQVHAFRTLREQAMTPEVKR